MPRVAEGLLQRRSHLAVPHAHWGLWKITLLLKHTGERKGGALLPKQHQVAHGEEEEEEEERVRFVQESLNWLFDPGMFAFTFNTPSNTASKGCIRLGGTSNLWKTTRSKPGCVKTGFKGTKSAEREMDIKLGGGKKQKDD